MRSPLEDGGWHVFDEVLSTQDLGVQAVKEGRGGVFFASHQTLGRGRLGREWLSAPGESLTMSMTFRGYAGHSKPHLIGMSVAAAAAAVIHCEVAWPNDLVAEGRKLGGILTEMAIDEQGRSVPVVGVGINLNQKRFPSSIADRATSVALFSGGSHAPRAIGEAIVARLAGLPEPASWQDVATVWNLFDHTPGKRYRTFDGKEAVALGIGPEGQLMCAIDGETASILAADAIFGPGGVS